MSVCQGVTVDNLVLSVAWCLGPVYVTVCVYVCMLLCVCVRLTQISVLLGRPSRGSVKPPLSLLILLDHRILMVVCFRVLSLPFIHPLPPLVVSPSCLCPFIFTRPGHLGNC